MWAGAAVIAVRRRRELRLRTALATVALAGIPDFFQMAPIVLWWLFGSGSFADVHGYAVALPGTEPALPPLVALFSHHLHCMAHSAIVAGAATLAVVLIRGRMWFPLYGWWLHVLIDMLTHSADYYASPVLYPLTYRGFDGIAWNQPWFMTLNYVALAIVGLVLVLTGRRKG